MTSYSRITLDREHRMLIFEAGGFLEIEAVQGVGAAKIAALRELGGSMTDHVSLVDVSACKIQSREVVEAVMAILHDRRYRARRQAFLVNDSSLAKMQVRRALEGVNSARLFEDRAAAMAWLKQADAEG